MNRIDRLNAILIQLQTKRTVKAKEIADRFNISLRTVYRDIRALEEAGVPVGGEAGSGYSMMEGYRLPPVMFTKEEAISLLTAEKLIEKFSDNNTSRQYNEAMYKIKAVMRYSEKDLLENMEQHIAVLENPYLPKPNNSHISLQTILQGVTGKLKLRMQYFANHSQQQTVRTVEPVGIFFLGSHWYMIAWCCLRKDYRHFRTDRISQLSLTSEHFQQQHPALHSFLSKMSREKEMHTVIIRVEPSVIQHFGDQKYYNGFVSQKEVNGKTEMTFVTGSLPGFAKFFLLFGEHAEIISPVSLKNMVRKYLSAIAKKIS